MKVQDKTKLKQLKTGVHLATILDVIMIKDDKDMPLIIAGETGITIRFSDGFNNYFDQDYWFGGNREHFFDKMAVSAGIDRTNKKFRAESRGKRLWLCIKEVHEIDGDRAVEDINGPVIHYYLFDTIPCSDPNKKPNVPGDPEKNFGIAQGAFLDYKQIRNEANLSRVEKNYPAQMENNRIAFTLEQKAIAEMEDGKVTSVTITNSGNGYTFLPAPTGNQVVDSICGLTPKDPWADY